MVPRGGLGGFSPHLEGKNYFFEIFGINSRFEVATEKLIMGKKDILSEEHNRGMVSQLVLNVHHLWHLLSLICKYLLYISSYIHFLI